MSNVGESCADRNDSLIEAFIFSLIYRFRIFPNKLASQDAVTEDCIQRMWTYLPDHLLLSIFQYLPPRTVLDVSQVCYQWHRVALDEFLWQDLFYRYFKINRNIPMASGMSSWRSEFKRLIYHTPAVESEVLHDHRDQVLHVSFAHNGRLFATTSKDGFVKVWNFAYPCTLKYHADMKDYTWKYTHFSQFNSSDTLLLVSGVLFESESRISEIAVFSIDTKFELQCLVEGNPYVMCGAWYNNSCFLSGNHYWRDNVTSSSVLKLNKASLDIESEHKSGVIYLVIYNFLNHNSSSIQKILVARCPEAAAEEQKEAASLIYRRELEKKDRMLKVTDDGMASIEESGVEECGSPSSSLSLQNDNQMVTSARTGYHTKERKAKLDDDAQSVDSDLKQPKRRGVNGSLVSEDTMSESCSFQCSRAVDDDFCYKYLIFAMGEKTFVPHQIGIKRIMTGKAKEIIDRLKQQEVRQTDVANSVEDPLQHVENDRFDSVDHMIELHGHIIGMCLSPDHRYLYVNSRAWPKGYEISDPESPPPIAEDIDIHVIDLKTLREVGGSLLRSHKAYTPNGECFFIYLDISSQYIASGSEEKHGYLWDRNYGIHLRKFQHNDVVNSVAFNSQDSEVLVTVSDDNSIKIWRSLNREKEVKGHRKL